MTPELGASLAFKFLALTLVGFRLTWLVIEDDIASWPRGKVIDWATRKSHLKLLLFVQCPWCIGFWVEAALVAVLASTGLVGLPLPVLWPFAINAVAAPLHHWVDKITRD